MGQLGRPNEEEWLQEKPEQPRPAEELSRVLEYSEREVSGMGSERAECAGFVRPSWAPVSTGAFPK
jgi:hypothetical protein